MRIRGVRALSGGVAAALLAACGGSQSQPPIGGPGAIPQSRAIAAHADRSGSWMLPEAKSEDLVYVTTFDSGIYVFDYASGKQVGIITNYGPASPEGLCTDPAGDVFVTGEFKIVEFAHGDAKPIATLTDNGSTGYFDTYDCAIDPVNGNLAATILDGADVAVFHHARGHYPKHYYAPDAVMFHCGYDEKGNLFTDTFRRHRRAIAELPAARRMFELIKLSQYIGPRGAIQWDGKYLAIEDLQTNVIYRVSVSGTTGTIMGSVTLSDAKYISSFWLQGTTLIGVDEVGNDIGYWKYPAGGSPFKLISGVSSPLAATVSLGKRGG